ncbi:FAD-dependent oxidoreductase [Dehalobacter sp. DCM]|uniref:oxidoreductase n=1 Tax=Dehalobacter sp. DCM TaxID=2907827 RepID=UPI00308142C7|nr:FAD-dependent oxidoreductase [Dehalobacter sp. DCM]
MAAFHNYPHVFTPIQVGPLKLKNRIQFAPMVTAHAHPETGDVTESLLALVRAQARSGAALVTIGSTPVDYVRARDFYGGIANLKESDVPQLMQVAEAVHQYNCKISCELCHAGRYAYPGALKAKAYVPWMSPDLDPEHFEEISQEGIEEVIDEFCASAKRLQQAGFDMLMIHGAHGNLVSAFFSPIANQRTDEYGGSLENRMRFSLTLLKRLRETIGPGMGIDFRISCNEYIEGCPTVDDIIAFLQKAQEYIDIVNFSAGAVYNHDLGRYISPSYLGARNQNVERVAAIRPHLNIPVSVVGGITGIEAIESIIREGKADMVAMARNLLADMELVTKAYRGHAEDIRPCLHCNACAFFPFRGAQVRCAINPYLGREFTIPKVEKADSKKKVMIIGGGPAGMTAAQTAAKRGHDVALFEASEKLGGRLYEASAMKLKDYHRSYLDWTIRQTERSGIRIALGVKVTPELVLQEAPDVLILAVGAEHIVPPIQGVELPLVITVSEADIRQKNIGKRVVMIGGGLSGTECAIDLAMAGHEVIVVDKLLEEQLLTDLFPSMTAHLRSLMKEHHIQVCYGAAVNAITGDSVRITLCDGSSRELACDTVILSVGLQPDEKWLAMISDLIPETYLIGDCRQVRNILAANADGLLTVVEI